MNLAHNVSPSNTQFLPALGDAFPPILEVQVLYGESLSPSRKAGFLENAPEVSQSGPYPALAGARLLGTGGIDLDLHPLLPGQMTSWTQALDWGTEKFLPSSEQDLVRGAIQD